MLSFLQILVLETETKTFFFITLVKQNSFTIYNISKDVW